MRYATGFILFLVVVLASAEPADTRGSEHQYEWAALRLVRITSIVPTPGGFAYSQGCGVIAGSGIYTAWHVVDGASRVIVRFQDGSIRVGVKFKRISNSDTGIILLNGRMPVRPLEVFKGKPGGTLPVLVSSHWGRGFKDGKITFTLSHLYADELVPALIAKHFGKNMIAGGFALAPGMSGSPVFHKGRLIGVCSLQPVDGVGRGFSYISGVR